MHGYGIAQRLKQVSESVLQVGESSLYPALQRLPGMLFGVAATNPLLFAVVVALVLLSALTASSGPVWRAARIDPIRTRRAE